MGVKRVPAIISVGSVILDGGPGVFGDRAWDGTTSIVVVVLDHSCIKDVRGSDRDEEAGAEAHGGNTLAVVSPSAVAIILFVQHHSSHVISGSPESIRESMFENAQSD